MSSPPTLETLGPLADAVARRLARLEEEDVVARIWRRDHTVWKPDPAEIANRLGWLTLATDMWPRVPELQAFAEQAAGEGFTHALLGMGGSSLAPEMFARTFGAAPGALELTVLDTTHPATIAEVERSLDLSRTLFIVASKSGTTLETLSQFEHFFALVEKGSSFVAITDPPPGGHHRRVRARVPAFDGPAPQRGPEHRRLPAGDRRRPGHRRARPRPALHVRGADRRPGAGGPQGAAGPRQAGGPGGSGRTGRAGRGWIRAVSGMER
ncbi:MAG TPA: hypothetical protein VKL22_08440 [Actinomycetota bacterium]|nr:hypothetical protein [Actinomycetota bacterium]